MTVERSTDASFTSTTDWYTIDWSSLRQEVRRLQMRIAKAIQAGHYRKAKTLQWLLTHSRSAKLLAVRKVTTNRGAKTPGVDHIKVRGEANPYDPRYTEYFERRRCFVWRVRWGGRKPAGAWPPPDVLDALRTPVVEPPPVPTPGAPVGGT